MPLRISLQPEGMEALSSMIPVTTAAVTKNESVDYGGSQMSPEHTKAKEEALKKSVSERVEVCYELEQDTMEGVDINEWDEN